MNKKIFAWIMALALVLTIMPVLDVHNHAEAETLVCTECGCSNFVGSYGGFGGGAEPCKNCKHHKKYHQVPVEHEWELSYSKEATCMQEGYDNYVCYACSYTHYEDRNHTPVEPNAHDFVGGFCINEDADGNRCTAHQHKWENGKCVRVDGCTATHDHTDDDFKTVDTTSIVVGNCTTASSYDLLCYVCGAAKTVTGEKDANNHKFVMGMLECQNGCGAECPHTTWTGDKCSVCGTGHNHPGEAYTSTLKTAATCVKPAVYTYTYACGAVETITGEVDPDAHTWTPTGECANTGCDQACSHNWVDGVCTECTFACKHTETTQTTTEAGNCKNVGSADLICDECGEVADTVELSIDPDNHDWVVFPFGAGYCNRCGEINVNYEDFEDVLPEKEPVEDPCDEHQWASLSFGAWYCTKCGATATDIKPLDPEICDHADTYIETVTPATCKKEGTAKEVCDICEEVLDENVVLPIDKENGHDWVVFPFGAGWCNRCSEVNVNYDDFIKPEDPKDTCEHDWLYVGIGWFCHKCEGVTTDENEVNAPKEEPEEPKYCEDNEHEWATLGFGAWVCLKCGANSTNIFPLEPDYCDHAGFYIDVTTPATCVATGLGNKVCDLCETVLEEGVEVAIDPDAHQWVSDENGTPYCELCETPESELPKEEPCEHDWAAVATGWYCWKCDSVTLDNPFASEPVVVRGDANDDGTVDGRDVIRLMKYLVGGASINQANSDVNEDGAIDGRDVIRLMKWLL